MMLIFRYADSHGEKGSVTMMDKEKLIDYIGKLTTEELNYLASHYQEIVALFEATAPRPHRNNSELTA